MSQGCIKIFWGPPRPRRGSLQRSSKPPIVGITKVADFSRSLFIWYRDNNKLMFSSHLFMILRKMTHFHLCSSLYKSLCMAPEMEMGHISWPMTHVTHHIVDPWPTWPTTHDPWSLSICMGQRGGVAWRYWTTLSVFRAKTRRLKLSLQLW